MTKPQDAFQALLDHEQAPATPEVAALAALATALTPVERPGPDLRFKARLRSELLAAATETADADANAFAAMLESPVSTVPAAIRPLVMVAKALEPAAVPVPAPAFRYQLRNKLVARAEVGPSAGARLRAAMTQLNTRMRRSLRVVAGTSMAATILAGSSGAMAVSAHALPVDKLYTVKMAKESAELWLRSGTPRGFVHLDHARTRLGEVRGMLDRPVADQAPYVTTLRRMDDQTSKGQTIIFEEFKNKAAPKEVVEQVDRFARQQLMDLAGLRERLPEGAQPAAMDSLTVLAMVVQRAETLLDCDCDAPADALVRSPSASGDQTFGCACDSVESADRSADADGGSGTGGSSTDGGTDPGDGDTGNGSDPDPDEPQDEGPVDVPEVPGDPDADDEVESIINDLLNQLPLPESSTGPTPSPELPSGPELIAPLVEATSTVASISPSL